MCLAVNRALQYGASLSDVRVPNEIVFKSKIYTYIDPPARTRNETGCLVARSLPLLGRTGTPVTKDAAITKTRRSRKRTKKKQQQQKHTNRSVVTGHYAAV